MFSGEFKSTDKLLRMASKIFLSFKTNSKIVLFSKISIQQLTILLVVSISFSKLSL